MNSTADILATEHMAEPRPRDFAARFTRKAKGIGARHRARHRGRRLAALALAVAVPAFAAPTEWQNFPSFDTAQAEPVKQLGFETKGESFPGSAFYYVSDDYAPRPMEALIHSDADPAPAMDVIGGPAGRAFTMSGSAIDKARALKCMTMAIYYEAATESDAGQRAVAQVVLNRVAHPAFPHTVCGVVFQGSERNTGCQFSFTCDGSLVRQPMRKFWDRAERVAMAALSGAVYRPVGLATHYHTVQIHPYWADSLTNVTTIGAHRFYRWRGTAGLPAAFTAAYLGGEPMPTRHASTTIDVAAGEDPVQLARAFEKTYEAEKIRAGEANRADYRPVNAAAALPRPDYSAEVQQRGGDALYSGERLPGSGSVKPEYARSGQWIGQP